MEDSNVTNPGTHIQIRELHESVSAEFSDPSFVDNTMAHIIARDYTRFIENGFKIFINDTEVRGAEYNVGFSDEFQPYRHSYEDGSVKVEILAGMSAPPPDSNDPEERERPNSPSYGWFVFCNDRVILAEDTTNRTVWGDEGFPHWHTQYNGFMGIVLFHASDPNLLPWTTTKRDIDEGSPLYRRAIKEMKKATYPWIDYTNRRKDNLKEAKTKEQDTKSQSVFSISANSRFRTPNVQDTPRIKMANINYQKPVSEVKKAAAALGNSNMPYRSVGEKTFRYFLDNETE